LTDSALPPSRFGAGFAAGKPTSSLASPVVPSAPAPPPGPDLNKLAVVTFVATLLLGLVVAPLTLPLSYLADRQIQASGQSGAGLARASMIISSVYLMIGAVVIGLYIYLRAANAVQ